MSDLNDVRAQAHRCPGMADWIEYPRSRTDRTIAPLYSFSRQGNVVFFVNHSEYTLRTVRVSGQSLQLIDEGAVSSTPEPTVYADVQPGEGVWVDEFDPLWDRDWMVGCTVTVASPVRGQESFGYAGKGGPGSIVLLWADGFVSPRVGYTGGEG